MFANTPRLDEVPTPIWIALGLLAFLSLVAPGSSGFCLGRLERMHHGMLWIWLRPWE
jgi:hypothetical protein